MSLSKRTRFEIFKRDSFRCVYCGACATETILHADHVYPRSLGGSDHPSNLVTSCWECNSGKGARRLDDIIPSPSHRAIVLSGHGCPSARDIYEVEESVEYIGAEILFSAAHPGVMPSGHGLVTGAHLLIVPPLGEGASGFECSSRNIHYWPRSNESRPGAYYRVPWEAIRTIRTEDGAGRWLVYSVTDSDPVVVRP